MMGIVLAAHGEIAPALLRAAEAIVGPLEATRALSLQAGQAPDELRAEVEKAVREVDQGDGVLVLCDMFGGTPSNVCLSCLAPASVRNQVVTGVNLPMLLKVATARSGGASLEDISQQIVIYGQHHIANASEMLRSRRDRQPSPPPAHADQHR